MSMLPRDGWNDRHARFDIVFEPAGARKPQVLRSAPDGDGATLAFDDEWDRLTAGHVAGMLLLVCRHDEPCTLLRRRLR
jgi:hypothetical protein